MKTLLCDFLTFKALYPHLGLAALWFLKGSFIVLIATALASALPSALARTWVWRIALISLLIGMLSELIVSSQSGLRIVIPVESPSVSMPIEEPANVISKDESPISPVAKKTDTSSSNLSIGTICDHYVLQIWFGVGGILTSASLNPHP